jgi:PleD family two-component response regulator
MGNNNEDDKPTVVLDIRALKAQMEKKTAKGDNAIDQEFEFAVLEKAKAENEEESADTGLSLDDELSLEEETDVKRVILFDLQSDYFQKLIEKIPKTFHYEVITELKVLNGILTKKEPVIILFNYNAAPKSVNQLTTQIKAKFPAAKTVIIAKGLTPEKALEHQKSSAGANAYLSIPFNVTKLEETIKNL